MAFAEIRLIERLQVKLSKIKEVIESYREKEKKSYMEKFIFSSSSGIISKMPREVRQKCSFF